jgi:hypothetical protein
MGGMGRRTRMPVLPGLMKKHGHRSTAAHATHLGMRVLTLKNLRAAAGSTALEPPCVESARCPRLCKCITWRCCWTCGRRAPTCVSPRAIRRDFASCRDCRRALHPSRRAVRSCWSAASSRPCFRRDCRPAFPRPSDSWSYSLIRVALNASFSLKNCFSRASTPRRRRIGEHSCA